MFYIMTIKKKFDEIKAIVSNMEKDVIGFCDKGVKQAGRRTRNQLQEIRNLAFAMRKEITEETHKMEKKK